MTNSIAPGTRAVRAGIETDTQHGAVVPPLHLSTNYSFAGFNQKRAYDYSRSGNPTRDLLAEALSRSGKWRRRGGNRQRHGRGGAGAGTGSAGWPRAGFA